MNVSKMMEQLTGQPAAFWQAKLDAHDAMTEKVDKLAAEYEAETGKPFIEYKHWLKNG